MAELLAFAFTLGGQSSATRRERLLVWMAFPGMFLSTLLGISLRQFWWRPGATLQLEDQRPLHRIGNVLRGPVIAGAGVILVFVVLIATVVAGAPAWILAAAAWVCAGAVALSLIGIFLTALSLGISGRERRRARRKAKWTHSRRTRRGTVTPPPRAPQWKITFLAGDPRVKNSGALVAAASILEARIPAGHIVCTVAASPQLVRLYQRWGFTQWHDKSLAMWAPAPGPR